MRRTERLSTWTLILVLLSMLAGTIHAYIELALGNDRIGSLGPRNQDNPVRWRSGPALREALNSGALADSALRHDLDAISQTVEDL